MKGSLIKAIFNKCKIILFKYKLYLKKIFKQNFINNKMEFLMMSQIKYISKYIDYNLIVKNLYNSKLPKYTNKLTIIM